MAEQTKQRTGGEILVDALCIHGVDTVFCVPGESYLAVLDGLHGSQEAIRTITCRHESGAANMAEAYGKLTGKPGICFVTRGPGATHASIGVHTAKQDSTPMIMFVGQIARGTAQRETFQEVDYHQMFGSMAKWVAEIDDARRIPELVGRAFHIAVSGRPGPVVISLPEDMLTDLATVANTGRYQLVQAHPGKDDLLRLRSMLACAQRPMVIVGGSAWSERACKDIQDFVSRNRLPVACSFRRQDIIDNEHENYVGDLSLAVNLRLAQRILNSDLIVAIGARLGEASTSGYTLIDLPTPKQRMVHVHAGVEELGKVYQGALMINAGPEEFATAVLDLPPIVSPAWTVWTVEARRDYEATMEVGDVPGPVNMGYIVKQLGEELPDNAIVTNGAGNYTVWVHRYHRYRRRHTQLAPTSGAMGYGVPAAIAAKIVHPDRPVVCFAGDGCFMMSAQELATAVHYHLHVVFIVVNNGMYGTIRMHQEREYPERVIATELTNPDFVSFAQSFGALGFRVERTEDFRAVFRKAIASNRTALIEVRVDPEALTPRATLSSLRAEALKRTAS